MGHPSFGFLQTLLSFLSLKEQKWSSHLRQGLLLFRVQGVCGQDP